MHRRDFLKRAGSLALYRPVLGATAAAGSLLTGGSLLAASQTDARLLVVFLRGGYDSANLLVPTSSDLYYETRPYIAVPRPGEEDGALPLTAEWALHPRLRNSLLPLYENKQVAFVPFAGSDDVSRSHFETQTTLELGQSLGGNRNYRSGFLNRLAQELGRDTSRPGAFTSGLPLILNGSLDVHNLDMEDAIKDSPFDGKQQGMLDMMYRDTALQTTVNEGFAMRQATAEAIRREIAGPGGQAVSARGLEGDMRRAAVVMREQFNIGFMDLGGWDTHVNQGGEAGVLASRLEALGQGLAGFAQGMGSTWDKTVVVVISEFGRTFRENGNRGTDHGYGTVYWVLGGGIQGGRIAGEQVKVGADTLHQDRDFPVLNDYRQVLGGLFQRMYGLDNKRLQRVFPGGKTGNLRLI